LTSELIRAVPGAKEWQAEIGHAIRTAALEVFSTMLGVDIEAGDWIVSRAEPEFHADVIALLGLTGEWAGSGQISVNPAFACRIASGMLMAEYDSVGEDVLDAVAEIANMVIGNIKNMLEVHVGTMGLSTPTIVFGGDFGTRVAGSPERIIVPFRCEGSSMTVQIVLAPRTNYLPRLERHHVVDSNV
jgi:chemotaxis protein CheX